MQSKSTLYHMVGRVCFFFLRFVQRERTGRRPPAEGGPAVADRWPAFGGRPAAQCFGLQKAEKFHNQSGMVGTASGGMGQV